jgi:hypothetical protein
MTGPRKGQPVQAFERGNMAKTKKTTKQGTRRGARQKPTLAKGAQASATAARGATADSRAAAGRARTKADRILALLKQPTGATLKSIMAATGWQAHSVRGFVSGHLVKKMGLRVKSYRRDGERVYAIK